MATLRGIGLAGPWVCLAGFEPIIVGLPTSLGLLEGKESLNTVNLAMEEINKAGGVEVGGVMRPFAGEGVLT